MTIAVRQSSTDRAVIADLRARLEQAEEENRQLRQALAAPEIEVSPAWRLTNKETQLYRALARTGRVMNKEALVLALYEPSADDPPSGEVIDVQVHHLRRKIKAFGGEIETAWGEGYRLARVPFAPEPQGLIPAADEATPGTAQLLRDLSGKWGQERGAARLFLLAVRDLAAHPDQVVPARDLAARLYAHKEQPRRWRTVIHDAIRRGRPAIEALGWEIAAIRGPGGGYWLRKKRERG